MSRSFRSTPYVPNVSASDAYGKRKANSINRRNVRIAIRNGDEILPELREVSNVHDFPKDGKSWVSRDVIRAKPYLMRK
jgi:hypothetical protein